MKNRKKRQNPFLNIRREHRRLIQNRYLNIRREHRRFIQNRYLHIRREHRRVIQNRCLNIRREHRKVIQNWTFQRNRQHKLHNTTKNKAKTQHNMSWNYYTPTNTNNVNKPSYKQLEVEMNRTSLYAGIVTDTELKT